MKMTTRQITTAGILSAISIFLGITHIGFIPFLGTSITIMHLPVIIGAVLEGPLVGTIIGALFGIFSLLQAYMAPSGPGDLFFRDPLVSIFPRLFIGVVAWAVYRAVKPLNEIAALALAAVAICPGIGVVAWAVYRAVQPLNEIVAIVVAAVAGTFIGVVAWVVYRAVKPLNEIVAIALAAVAGTLTNTVLVLGMLVLRQYIPPTVAWVVALTNGPFELIAAVIITVAVVAAWKRLEYGRKGADL